MRRVAWRAGVVAALAALCNAWQADFRSGALSKDEPQPVYADDPGDSWNRIFYHLFTRTAITRLSSEFYEGAPFTRFPIMGFGSLDVSRSLFQRIESEDRAFDPLYPSFLSQAGPSEVLKEPRYTLFVRALDDALREDRRRSVIARALMQCDLWAAFDILHPLHRYPPVEGGPVAKRADTLLTMLARLIRKIALTPEEIGALPDSYARLSRADQLPGLFDEGTPWIEVEWLPHREHDLAADFRRVAHVFVKPAMPPADKQRFLNDLRREDVIPHTVLDGVALVIRPLAIDTNGHVEPTRLVTEVQFRVFSKNRNGERVKTEVLDYELNRRLSVAFAESSGLKPVAETDPAYLPESGNDYGFGSVQREQATYPPVLARLGTRCVACHGSGAENVFTFRVHAPEPQPPVRQLKPRFDDECAHYVVGQKVERPDWKALHVMLESAAELE
jgi:hypothetical protein